MDVQLLLREKSYEEYVHLNHMGNTKCENRKKLPFTLHLYSTTYSCNATIRTFISRKPENKVSIWKQKFVKKKKYNGKSSKKRTLLQQLA